jgi:glutamate-1-semialdehyde 2,1-aminomutase
VELVIVIQARMGSKRLPGKVLLDLGGQSTLQRVIERVSRSKYADKIVVATSDNAQDDALAEYCSNLNVRCVRGSEDNVQNRFLKVAEETGAETIVRITADCPLVDPEIMDEAIQLYLHTGCDYVSNVTPATFPDGLDVEVFSTSALVKASTMGDKFAQTEHVTSLIRESDEFNKKNIENDKDLSQVRWTLDNSSDLEVLRGIYALSDHVSHMGWKDVYKLYQEATELHAMNSGFLRNYGSEMTAGQKLWERAKSVIPGGNSLLSKRPEMFLPEKWPSYFSKAQGCNVWDLDGKQYIDMSIMGIGTNTLGYGNFEVDEAVRKTISNGNMSTLNAPEEVYLAEKLVEINPWADMVRFARTGGEANAIAVRIARAASGKDNVAICGYHGWHDWYLSANLAEDQNLDGHLLPGLEPNGVPRSLAGSTVPFEYNDFEALERLVSAHDIGVIKMEVTRNFGPENDFLAKVRQLATERGVVLIFDECTSGFRESFGGIYQKYGVEPDIAIYGKTLGNGYAITAVVGRREVMQYAQTTFMSSTFWTERIGPSAALATLDQMEKTRSWESITSLGAEMRSGWQQLADENDIAISHFGIPALAGFSFKSEKTLYYKTFITQEMLKAGYLAGTSFYASTAHNSNLITRYLESLSPVFRVIAECEDGRDVASLLEGPVCHSGFRRLN